MQNIIHNKEASRSQGIFILMCQLNSINRDANFSTHMYMRIVRMEVRLRFRIRNKSSQCLGPGHSFHVEDCCFSRKDPYGRPSTYVFTFC